MIDTFVRFIIVDDDIINNTLCSFIIKRVATNAEIELFNLPEKAFTYLAEGNNPNEKTTMLFLDINMPDWTGWFFLEKFDQLSEEIKKNIKIYMLSSSVDLQDREKAKLNKYVVDFIVKPLTKNKVISILAANK
jgi:two-component SAPR family response regulator